jgi:hypothetical protein
MYSVGIWNILLPFGIFYGKWVNFVVIWYFITSLGNFYKENSGNPALHCSGFAIEYIDSQKRNSSIHK